MPNHSAFRKRNRDGRVGVTAAQRKNVVRWAEGGSLNGNGAKGILESTGALKFSKTGGLHMRINASLTTPKNETVTKAE